MTVFAWEMIADPWLARAHQEIHVMERQIRKLKAQQAWVTLDDRYLRVEDVADFIRSLGATEETDVRNRLNQAADNLL